MIKMLSIHQYIHRLEGSTSISKFDGYLRYLVSIPMKYRKKYHLVTNINVDAAN